MDSVRGFKAAELPASEAERIRGLGKTCRGDILQMTTLAASGHPGGSMSSLEIYLTVYGCADIDPAAPQKPDRDMIVVSHGHTSPGVYSVLGRMGFFDVEQAVATFRQPGSPFEGHVEHCVPGVEWSTGNLGQGLSAACGFALSKRLRKLPGHVYCLMSDGEQAKGQVAEARRFATKYGLNDVTVVIDYNQIQISGNLHDVMPQNIKACYEADGWKVVELDGHDAPALYAALRAAREDRDNRHAILAGTVIGKGVSFMEGKYKYHGQALSEEECATALAEIGVQNELDRFKTLRSTFVPAVEGACNVEAGFRIEQGEPKVYAIDQKTDNRSAFGTALLDIAKASAKMDDPSPMAVLDCDLASSVKTSGFAKEFPDNFFQVGVQEHNAAVISGALSARGVVTFFADFGMFGMVETYNQHRLSDINWANVKLACTHCGLDVGEDGKTHQCIDYIGLLRNLFGFRAVVPGDPNQTDRAVRHVAGQAGNWFIGMGRSKLPVIDDGTGNPFFGKDYRFEYGKIDRIRQGKDATILAYGVTLARAMTARTLLAGDGIEAGVWNVSCPKDPEMEPILEAARRGPLVVYEDHISETGLAGVVAMILARHRVACPFRAMGVTGFSGSGKPEALFREAGLAPEDVARTVRELLGGE